MDEHLAKEVMADHVRDELAYEEYLDDLLFLTGGRCVYECEHFRYFENADGGYCKSPRGNYLISGVEMYFQMAASVICEDSGCMKRMVAKDE
jgi:hypothetical protein